jgi:hypothetical protein
MIARELEALTAAIVRTPGGAKKFGQAIGSVIVRDETPRALARELRGRAALAEPEVSAVLKEVVEARGGHLQFFPHRLKTQKSMTRKLRDKSIEKGITAKEYAAKVGDALRYTAIMDPDVNIAGAQEILDSLEAKGHTVLSVENSWELGDDYSGININMQAPNGVIWELQIHTPDSFEVKEYTTHPDYEIMRQPDKYSLEERQAAYDRMVAAWPAVKQPAGWETFGTLIYRYRRPGMESINKIRRPDKARLMVQ